MDGLHGVPMVGRGDDDGIDVFAFQEVTIIAVGCGALAGGLGGVGQAAFVGVADGRDIHVPTVSAEDHVVKVSAAHAADADHADGESFIGARDAWGAEDSGTEQLRQGQDAGGGGGGRLQETATGVAWGSLRHGEGYWVVQSGASVASGQKMTIRF